jgi:hypothetical protein
MNSRLFFNVFGIMGALDVAGVPLHPVLAAVLGEVDPEKNMVHPAIGTYAGPLHHEVSMRDAA